MAKIDIKNLSRRQRIRLHGYVRAGVQLIFFIAAPGAFTAAFGGVKSIASAVGSSEPLALTSFVMTLAALCAFTIIFGRFFCGFACAFGSLGDALHGIYAGICRKRKKRVKKLPEKLMAVLSACKYVVLAVIVYMCYQGIYGMARGTSPWDVFSMFRAMNVQLGGYTIGVILLLLLMAGMFFQERFFCRCFCPMGAVFSLLPVLPLFSLQRDRDQCRKGCSACTMMCPSDIELPKNGSPAVMGDCFQCQKCIDTCPQGNVHIGLNKVFKGNEVIWTVVRAALLLGLMKWLGM